jgi:hypothetical protein
MRALTFLAAALALAVACDDTLGIGAAQIQNRTDSLVSLYALSGTPVALPSGYVIASSQPVRTDRAVLGFDFAFDIDTAGRAVLLPTGALRLGRGSGIQLTDTPFDSVRIAPSSGYQLDSAVTVTLGDVAIAQSRPNTNCIPGLIVSFYAKLQVLAVDTVERRLDFRILTDRNCGYRGLEPGLPTR